jgi:hypothetical protein
MEALEDEAVRQLDLPPRRVAPLSQAAFQRAAVAAKQDRPPSPSDSEDEETAKARAAQRQKQIEELNSFAGFRAGDNAAPSGPVDLHQFPSAGDLAEALSAEELKGELQRLGLKCGGAPLERAERLFLAKGVPEWELRGALDKRHFAKPKKVGIVYHNWVGQEGHPFHPFVLRCWQAQVGAAAGGSRAPKRAQAGPLLQGVERAEGQKRIKTKADFAKAGAARGGGRQYGAQAAVSLDGVVIGGGNMPRQDDW